MIMHFYEVTLIISSLIVGPAQLNEIGRKVEGGFEVLNTGPIQLIVPDVLSFTIRNEAHCRGLFRICYLSVPNASRLELERRGYWNMGGNCPIGYCTLALEPEHDGVFGLSAEWHDGNVYGMLVEGTTTMCPRYVANGLSNFTVIDVPDCSVIIDAARLPKEKTIHNTKDKTFNIKLIVAICIGFALLLLIIGIVGLYICTRPKKGKKDPDHPDKPIRQVGNSPKADPRSSPANKQLEKTSHVASKKHSTKQDNDDCSNSAASNAF